MRRNKCLEIIVISVLLINSSFTYGQQRGNMEVINNNRPNIIVFLVDDMGWMDTSVPFYDSMMPLNRRYNTPNMERLAAQGVKFNSAYAQPVCTPSRVSYLTGMNAAHSGVTNWTSPYRDRSTDVKDDQFLPLEWNVNGLSNVPAKSSVYATPLPQLLKENGYFTIHVGKAHWGSMGTSGANPLNLGFMVNIAGHAAGHPQSYLSEQWYGNLPGKNSLQSVPDLEQYYDKGVFLTEALTREALKTLEEPIKRKIPFFLNMAHYALHTPIMADDRFVQKYYDRGSDSIEAKYASLVEGMDKSLGDIMDFLEDKDIAENTIIIFMSDNGGLDEHSRGGGVNTHNYPLRSGKGAVYEGGIREPMIVKWPGVAKSKSVTKSPVIIEDFFPTILEMAGIKKYNTVQNIDGVSFVPLLKNPASTTPPRPLIFHYPHKWIDVSLDRGKELGINYYTAMRWGDWKVVYSLRDEKVALYNLEDDIREHENRADKEQVMTLRLAKIMGQTLRNYHAKMPKNRNTGKRAKYPDATL